MSGWNATVVQVSGVTMLGFGGLVLACALIIVKQSGSARPRLLRADRVTSVLGLIGAVGLVLSSTALYITYHPYSEIFHRFIRQGDASHIRELTDFLNYTQVLPGVGDFYQTLDFVSYFWMAVTVLGVIGLVLMVLRHFRSHPRATAQA